MAGTLEGGRYQEERFQAVFGGPVLQEHGIPWLPQEAAGSHEAGPVRREKLPLYYLALFSRSETAFKFWDDVLRYGADQKNLWD
jgi:hypothetical protein